RQRSTRLMSRSIGFSHRTALPVRAEAVIRSTCVLVEEATTTASTSGSASAAAGSGAVRAPICPASSLAAFATGSTIDLARARGLEATFRACSFPIRPAPKTQKVSLSFAMNDPPGKPELSGGLEAASGMIEDVLVDDEFRIDLAIEAVERVARRHFGHTHGTL